jgi:hypothetical protein
MEKGQRPTPERKRARSITLKKETLRQLEASELREVAGAIATLGGTSCALPCYPH